jgi:hypothetical protein
VSSLFQREIGSQRAGFSVINKANTGRSAFILNTRRVKLAGTLGSLALFALLVRIALVFCFKTVALASE